jgi:hypothetical protein
MRSSQPVRRGGRGCSRASCRKPATRTLTYVYSDSTAILGALSTFAEPHAYDLCNEHAERLTLPNGWTVIKADERDGEVGPNSDDIMAIADAVREMGNQQISIPVAPEAANTQEIGRRGHLRALPSR